MVILLKAVAAVAAGVALATTTFAKTAMDIRDASPYLSTEKVRTPWLIVGPPLSDRLARGVAQIQYRVENVQIVPVSGPDPLNPRHSHITVDDLTWHWAATKGERVSTMRQTPPSPFRLLIEWVNSERHIVTGRVVTLTGSGAT